MRTQTYINIHLLSNFKFLQSQEVLILVQITHSVDTDHINRTKIKKEIVHKPAVIKWYSLHTTGYQAKAK